MVLGDAAVNVIGCALLTAAVRAGAWRCLSRRTGRHPGRHRLLHVDGYLALCWMSSRTRVGFHREQAVRVHRAASRSRRGNCTSRSGRNSMTRTACFRVRRLAPSSTRWHTVPPVSTSAALTAACGRARTSSRPQDAGPDEAVSSGAWDLLHERGYTDLLRVSCPRVSIGSLSCCLRAAVYRRANSARPRRRCSSAGMDAAKSARCTLCCKDTCR